MRLFDIENALLSGAHVTLLVRHAERPPLEPGDTTFGATLPITERGREMARRYGMMLSHIVKPERVQFFASSTLRTVQTAQCIWQGLFAEDAPDGTARFPDMPTEDYIPTIGILGSDSPFFGSLDERMSLIAEGRYRERLNDYFSVGTQRGYNPLGAATEKMESVLTDIAAHGVGELAIAVTHDVNVACFLAGRKIQTSFSEETWPYYLDAAVILSSYYGLDRYGVLRWDRAFDGIDI